jgi:lysophospholipase L1-like esterase
VGQPGGGRVRIEAQGVYIATLDTNMPQKVAARASWPIPPETTYLELHVEDGPVRLFCFEFEKDTPGVIYSSIGLNGASATVLGAFINGDHLRAVLQEARPDLVVLNYGTNESNFPNYIDTNYARDERNMVSRVRHALPDASILMISPLDHGVRDSGGSISTAPALPRLIKIQQDIAREFHCAYFNTFEAMGGAGTMGRWYAAEPRLVAADFIHPLPNGARIVGTLLFNAIRDGYNRYKLEQMRAPGRAAPEAHAEAPQEVR